MRPLLWQVFVDHIVEAQFGECLLLRAIIRMIVAGLARGQDEPEVAVEQLSDAGSIKMIRIEIESIFVK